MFSIYNDVKISKKHPTFLNAPKKYWFGKYLRKLYRSVAVPYQQGTIARFKISNEK